LLLLLKILFLPIWLPVKIISELIEHSGRTRRGRRSYAGRSRTRRGSGCLATLLVIAVLAAIGAIAQSCGAAQPAVHKPSVSRAPAASASPPSPSGSVVPVASQPASSAPSCYPLTNAGNCYEPGEFCRHSDEGTTGVAGDGAKIKCEDNNGWRWEPV
jgi:hypothetical protein